MTILFVLAIISACTNKKTETIVAQPEEIPDYIIKLSQEQIDESGIKAGKIEKRKLSESLECSGNIDVLPKDRATISPVISGFVNDVFVNEGDYVKAGAILVSLSHPDFIALQQQYLENKSQVNYFEQEFKRQGELTVENAASIKNMQKAQAEYWTAQAAYKSAKTNLELLGIDPAIIDKGDFIKEFKVKAPIAGYVSNLRINKGRIIEPADAICEVINFSLVMINLNIYEKDLNKLKTGQRVVFFMVNDNKNKFITTIQNIGVQIDNTDRVVKAICKYNNVKGELHPGMYIGASILLNEKEVFCLPSSAVAEHKDKSYIFVKKEMGFEKQLIKTGLVKDEYIEIINPSADLLSSEIVVDGTYFLMTETDTEE
ncbi:MAG: hypothetical protein A2W99_10930 [Bacteroidetes bacterium GWF2_33_16]|nr:MAG: hypothetical protein A2W99_10930 [Bacteroidetes bacterium GWF2_33_16]